jgi:Zn-dependent peptidase ImmA (M78 family)
MNTMLIALNRTRPGERMRFTAAHELGHWIMSCLKRCREGERGLLPSLCWRLPVPQGSGCSGFWWAKRSRAHPVELLNAKRRYGVSMQVACVALRIFSY